MESTKSTVGTNKVVWASTKKLAFRFLFIFLALTTWFSGYNVVQAIFNISYTKWRSAMWFFAKPLYWLDRHIYHIGFQPDKEPYFEITDWQLGWVLVITSAWLAVAGCIVWSLADRKRPNYNRLNYWFRTYLIYFLAMAVVVYGIEKIIPIQMPFPEVDDLRQPLGNNTGYDLLWDFIGSNPVYSIFTGTCELIACLLILARRTRIFGYLFMATVLTNVVALNICYNIMVKLSSTLLLLVDLYLLAPYIPKLFRFFYKMQPVSLAEKRYTFDTPWKKWVVMALLLAPAWVIYSSIVKSSEYYNNEAHKVQKVYDVTYFIKGADTLQPLPNDTMRIKELLFTDYRKKDWVPYVTVYDMKGGIDYWGYKWDTTAKQIMFFKKDAPTKCYFHYVESANKQLALTGGWKGQNVRMVLDKFEVDSLPLVKEKIQWVRIRQ